VVSQPAITDLGKLREMLRKVENTPSHPVTKLAMRMIALTVVRPGTLHTTPWTEFNDLGDPAVWKIPPARMKMDREHWVPLATQALDILAVLRPVTGRCPYAFPNDRWAHKPMSENALLMLIYRAGYRGLHTPHGWRASFNTIMAERAQGDASTDKLLDIMLAHASNSGPYNRAMLLDQRRAMVQEWADLLLEGFAPAESLVVGARR
jgi:integrase